MIRKAGIRFYPTYSNKNALREKSLLMPTRRHENH
jgi:hypothetical protein